MPESRLRKPGYRQTYPGGRAFSSAVRSAATATQTCSSTVTPVVISGISVTVTSPGPSKIYLVTLNVDGNVGTAGNIGVVQLRIDGTAYTTQGNLVMGSPLRGSVSYEFVISGLAAGAHTFTAQLLMATSGSVTSNAGNTAMRVVS